MSRELILGPQAPMDNSWFTQTQISIGKSLGQSCPPSPPSDPSLLNDYTVNLHYYDLAQCEYTNHARSNDPQFLTYARNAADSYWQHPWIGAGKNRPWPDKAEPSPRHANVGGLILRAMDGKPEYWDWLVEYAKAAMNTWLIWRLTNTKLHNGVREGAFTLHYAVWLSQTLPDSYPLQAGGTATNGATTRAWFLTNAEKVATDYFGRLQFPDGSWRWDDFDASGGPFIGITQPFMVGLLLSALADLHQVTTNLAVKASVAAQITTAAKHLCFAGPYTKQWVAGLSVPLNGFHYFYHGGTQSNPTSYEKGSYPADWNTTDPSEIQNARQAIGPTIHGLMYAAKLTGDTALRTVVNEMWQSAYGDADRFHNYMRAGDGKSYNQNDRRAGSALALMGESVVQPPPPPPPPPPPTTSPDGTKAVTITDASGGAWTIGPLLQTLRNNVHMGGGSGTVYKWLGGVVYVLGTNNWWYRWTGTSWQSISSQVEPGAEPTVRTVTWPKQQGQQNTLLDSQWANGKYRLKRIDGNNASFEKVL